MTKENLTSGSEIPPTTPEKKKKKNKGKHKTETKEEIEEVSFGCEAPIDIDELKTIDDAKAAYSKLLRDYLEHQSVLDTIITEKKARVEALRNELINLGWSPPQPKEVEIKRKHGT